MGEKCGRTADRYGGPLTGALSTALFTEHKRRHNSRQAGSAQSSTFLVGPWSVCGVCACASWTRALCLGCLTRSRFVLFATDGENRHAAAALPCNLSSAPQAISVSLSASRVRARRLPRSCGCSVAARRAAICTLRARPPAACRPLLSLLSPLSAPSFCLVSRGNTSARALRRGPRHKQPGSEPLQECPSSL